MLFWPSKSLSALRSEPSFGSGEIDSAGESCSLRLGRRMFGCRPSTNHVSRTMSASCDARPAEANREVGGGGGKMMYCALLYDTGRIHTVYAGHAGGLGMAADLDKHAELRNGDWSDGATVRTRPRSSEACACMPSLARTQSAGKYRCVSCLSCPGSV